MNIIFLCHGSICRSPAAMMIAKSKTNRHEFRARALSHEEIGNDIYPPMKRALDKLGVAYSRHEASFLSKEDIMWADRLYYMDESNRRLLSFHYPEALDKSYPLYRYMEGASQIEDPWYSGNYDLVVRELSYCIDKLLSEI